MIALLLERGTTLPAQIAVLPAPTSGNAPAPADIAGLDALFGVDTAELETAPAMPATSGFSSKARSGDGERLHYRSPRLLAVIRSRGWTRGRRQEHCTGGARPQG
ncbi:MAG: hypothetical protein IPH08_01190 [Rhodocyclaceae bacterium]|nr:hypothetical protein [Rhodocyclaceae bacterium]